MEEQNQTLGIQCHQGETLLSHLVMVMYGAEDWMALAIMMTHQTRQMLRQYEPDGMVHVMWVAFRPQAAVGGHIIKPPLLEHKRGRYAEQGQPSRGHSAKLARAERSAVRYPGPRWHAS